MQQNFNGIKVLFSKAESMEEIKNLPSKQLFDEDICEFLNDLSTAIRKDKESRMYPDIVTFGFFLRKANIERLKQEYKVPYRVGRGFSFHIAPSNVPINFAYTLVAGLLAGNACVVRASSKDFPQTRILCSLMEKVVQEKATNVGKYIAVVEYERDKKITDYLSEMADVRVIWGGDNTVSEIRKSELPARSVEVTFADRYSICVLDAKEVAQITNWEEVAQNFYNDTYLYDQNACSSPRLMYWLGNKEEVEKAQNLFWNAIEQSISKKYVVEPVIAVDKLTMDYRIAIDYENTELAKTTNLFHRIALERLDKTITEYCCPGGSFLEYQSENLEALKPIVTKKYQTMSYLGCNAEEIANWVMEAGLAGIDRIVPMGKTADFTLIWDGYNLMETMSRKIYFE